MTLVGWWRYLSKLSWQRWFERAIVYRTVMAGLVPAIHGFTMEKQDVDDRHKGGHDTGGLGDANA